MSRGVVLWPDPDASASIRLIWDALADQGLPSLATMTHQLHRPHVSLIVAEDFPVKPVLHAVGRVPRQSVPLEVENLGIFPQGVLFLSCIVNRDLLSEHLRIRNVVEPFAVAPWPHSRPNHWVPHVSLGYPYTNEQLASALPIVLEHLPIRGVLDHGGVEDGTTGESWPSQGEDGG
jgi:hypothetical protein